MDQSTKEQEFRRSEGASLAQVRMWILDAQSEGTLAYHVVHATRLSGKLNISAFRRALKFITRRHDALRSCFSFEDGFLRVDNLAEAVANLKVVDVPEKEACNDVRLEGFVVKHIYSDSIALTAFPLFRAYIFRLSADSYVFVLKAHHIIMDGWSLGVFTDELRTAYNAFSLGETLELDLPASFLSFVQWEQHQDQRDRREIALQYWMERLRGIKYSSFPRDYHGGAEWDWQGERIIRTIPANQVAAIEKMSRRMGVSMFVWLLTPFTILMSKHIDNQSIVVGIPVANRVEAKWDKTIGLFVNTLALRCDLNPGDRFKDAAVRLRSQVSEALAQQEAPFDEVVERLHLPRDAATNPLFGTMFTFQSEPPALIGLKGLKTSRWELETNVARFPMEWTLGRRGDEIRLSVLFKPRLYRRETVERNIAEYQQLLNAFLTSVSVDNRAAPNFTQRAIKSSVIKNSVEEKENVTQPRQYTSVIEQFEEITRKFPNRIAVRTISDSCTFAELERLSNQLANVLIRDGIREADVVAIHLPSGIKYVLILLAVAKAGAVFFPLSVNDPQKRSSELISQANAKAIITSTKQSLDFTSKGVAVYTSDELLLKANLESIKKPIIDESKASLAYIVFTSGTSGSPKGVAIEHKALWSCLNASQKCFKFTQDDVFGVIASPSFDIFFFELFCPILAGGTAFMVDLPDLFQTEALYRVLKCLTCIHAVPLLMRSIFSTLEKAVDKQEFLIRRIFIGGDLVPAELLNRMASRLPNANITVLYGPSEATIISTYYNVPKNTMVVGHPIGRALPHCEIQLLTPELSEVRNDGTGEIFISGPNLARCYVPETPNDEKRFVLIGGRRCYRTGDLAQRNIGGELEFLGRHDRQIKIAGVRIQPEEIENVIRRHHQVADAVIIGERDEEENGRLIAYVVPTNHSFVETPARDELVHGWRQLFDSVHGDEKSPQHLTRGWISSYTGKPFSKSEMNEWTDTTVDRILENADQSLVSARKLKVLEIGVGTGLIMRKVAPFSQIYDATDFSASVVSKHRQEFRKAKMSSLKFYKLEACEDFVGQVNAYDVVILNSVVQYFPSKEYLIQVLSWLMPKLTHDGILFVGDLRSLAVSSHFYASLCPPQVAPSVLNECIADCAIREEELLVCPSFWGNGFGEETNCLLIAPRRGRKQNEMTKFRYDCVLGGQPTTVLNINWEEWAERHESADDLESRIIKSKNGLVALRNVPNKRLAIERALIKGIDVSAMGSAAGIDPEECHRIIERHGWSGSTSWASADLDGSFDLIISKTKLQARVIWPPLRSAANAPLTNVPILNLRRRKFEKTIGSYLSAKLPQTYVPSQIVILEALPITVHGKVDILRLPKPGPGVKVQFKRISKPKGVQAVILRIFSKVLEIKGISEFDSFFEIGGKSLSAIRVVAHLNRHGYSLALSDIFKYQSAARLAEYVKHPERRQMSSQLSTTSSYRQKMGPSRSGRYAVNLSHTIPPLRSAGAVFVTGATGYLGSYVLRELLTQTQATIYCLVRPSKELTAHERLRQKNKFYFGTNRLSDRIVVLEGDLLSQDFGLAKQALSRLREKTEHVFHIAADVRHFAAERILWDTNVESIRKIVENFSWRSRIHYFSSLAVRGIAGSVERNRFFSELDYNIGQEFQNPYSESKYMAEGVIRSVIEAGGDARVYRFGTVGADSESGQFQQNIGDHFFSRLIYAMILCKTAPNFLKLCFKLNPVNVLAKQIVTIAAADLPSFNTFHIETPYEITYRTLIENLRACCYKIEIVPTREFRQLYAKQTSQRLIEAFGLILNHFGHRGIKRSQVKSLATGRILKKLKVPYIPLPDGWILPLIKFGIRQGFFQRPLTPKLNPY